MCGSIFSTSSESSSFSRSFLILSKSARPSFVCVCVCVFEKKSKREQEEMVVQRPIQASTTLVHMLVFSYLFPVCFFHDQHASCAAKVKRDRVSRQLQQCSVRCSYFGCKLDHKIIQNKVGKHLIIHFLDMFRLKTKKQIQCDYSKNRSVSWAKDHWMIVQPSSNNKIIQHLVYFHFHCTIFILLQNQ